MKTDQILFVHRAFPGQFERHVRWLGEMPNLQLFGLGQVPKPVTADMAKLANYFSYDVTPVDREATHPYLLTFDTHIRRGLAAAKTLKSQGDELSPKVIFCHAGFGDALFLRETFPAAKIVGYFEYFYHATDSDVDFDPEFPPCVDDEYRIRIKNTTHLQMLGACDRGIAPTHWQKRLFPPSFQQKMQILHDGIDTAGCSPDSDAFLQVGDAKLKKGQFPIVTFVARSLEPYRGFHSFMRAIPLIQKKYKNALFLIVGDDDVTYGRQISGKPLREQMLEELAGQLDTTRIFFLGRVSYQVYLNILKISSAHVYLTYPFVPGWSLLEAMSCGAPVVAANVEPVQEFVEDGVTGLLADFFDYKGIAEQVLRMLGAGPLVNDLCQAARASVVERYDWDTVIRPRFSDLLNELLGEELSFDHE